jgi:hypothetical protein
MRKALIATLFATLFALPAFAEEIAFPPKLIECGASVANGDALWNEKVFGIDPAKPGTGFWFANRVRVIAAGTTQVRIQIGVRNGQLVLDTVYDDIVAAGPLDVIRHLGAIPVAPTTPTTELVIRVACTNGQFGGLALGTVFLTISQ